jgi:CRP-like cAMP-binding protein
MDLNVEIPAKRKAPQSQWFEEPTAKHQKPHGCLTEDETVEFLAQVPLLRSLSLAQRQVLAQRLVRKHYTNKTAVFHEGDVGDGFYLISEGAAQVIKKDAVTSKDSSLAVLAKGDYFGEMALRSADSRRMATITATVDLSVLFLAKTHFVSLVKAWSDSGAVIRFCKRTTAVSGMCNAGVVANINSHFRPEIHAPKDDVLKEKLEKATRSNLLFRDLEHRHRVKLVEAMYPSRVTKGSNVVVEGQPGNHFYVIEKGTFGVFRSDANSFLPDDLMPITPPSRHNQLASNPAATPPSSTTITTTIPTSSTTIPSSNGLTMQGASLVKTV